MTEFSEKAKTIGVSLRRGKAIKKPVTNEDNGKRAGYHIEHWDDHQDAIVQPQTLRVKIKSSLKEE